jgi:hypothetical protein
MKINGWQRIGIIASVGWMLFAVFEYVLPPSLENGGPLIAIVIFVPIVLAWGAVYLLLFLIRWVRRGF